ncbi:MAG: YHYH protein, partial [Luteolibacter sp.]
IKENLIAEIRQEERELTNGQKAMCYIIKTKSVPHEHGMGPWAPKKLTDGKDKGGIWFKDGQLYDVDGPFIKGLAELYNDPQWKLYNDDGTIKVTLTKEAFEKAARPDVDPEYNNYAVEGNPEWVKDLEFEFAIPVTPVYREKATRPGRGSVGIAFNGVGFDPPAPVHAIIAAHTIAPFDDHGGHINPHEGYHYHAATGHTKEIKQEDGHAPMIGYAMDGHGIFARLDEDGKAPEGLDDSSGHYDEIRGYHYHVSAPAENSIIKSMHGETVVKENENSGDHQSPPDGGPPHNNGGRPGPSRR